MNAEVTVCSCLAQYGYVPCTCSVKIPQDPAEVEAYMDIYMGMEALQAAGVCTHCGCIEEECECRF